VHLQFEFTQSRLLHSGKFPDVLWIPVHNLQPLSYPPGHKFRLSRQAAQLSFNESIYRDIITQEKEDNEKFRQVDSNQPKPATSTVNDSAD